MKQTNKPIIIYYREIIPGKAYLIFWCSVNKKTTNTTWIYSDNLFTIIDPIYTQVGEPTHSDMYILELNRLCRILLNI